MCALSQSWDIRRNVSHKITELSMEPPCWTAGMFCRLQVAGCGLKFNYNWKTAGTYKNVQAVDLPWLLHDPVYDRSVRLLPPSCQTGRSDGRRVYSNDFKPAMNYWFGINVWNIIWNSCWIWFLPREYQNESAQWASLCAFILVLTNIFRRLKSYIILFL